jgi:hypothetical protein
MGVGFWWPPYAGLLNEMKEIEIASDQRARFDHDLINLRKEYDASVSTCKRSKQDVYLKSQNSDPPWHIEGERSSLPTDWLPWEDMEKDSRYWQVKPEEQSRIRQKYWDDYLRGHPRIIKLPLDRQRDIRTKWINEPLLEAECVDPAQKQVLLAREGLRLYDDGDRSSEDFNHLLKKAQLDEYPLSRNSIDREHDRVFASLKQYWQWAVTGLITWLAGGVALWGFTKASGA